MRIAGVGSLEAIVRDLRDPPGGAYFRMEISSFRARA